MSSYTNLNALMENYAKNSLAGCSCALTKGEEIVYENYAGFADIEKGIPFGPDTVCRLFSMTKVIMCTAAMMLFERGKFLLNDPLSEYFPEYASPMVVKKAPDGREYVEKAQKPLLVKHAFSMACGLPYANPESVTGRAMLKVQKELREKYGRYDLQTEIKAMSQVPIAFEPGTHFLYGYGHELVAGLIEKVSGKSVGQFLKEEISEPLGMKDTAYRFFGDISSRMAVVYTKTPEGKLVPNEEQFTDMHAPDNPYEAGGAGLFSTLRDYTAFSRMLACGGTYKGQKIIGRRTIDLMRANQMNEDQLRDFHNPYLDGYGYGLGVRVMMSPAEGNSNTPVGEFGWTGMLGTWASICPEENFSAIYMHQMMPNEEVYHHLRIRAAAYGTL